ncbi:leucine-rich repeat protein [Butyrivibrio sp. WCD2001]|uniref:leucine-rich repeat protein n=1 Tax=Butyrivibrio sp. WCD2001 TaxID=1280681 RepID=UPI000422DA68|nr:leucine-rich repeat protein [Butyrivibrio sp. WCD2001]
MYKHRITSHILSVCFSCMLFITALFSSNITVRADSAPTSYNLWIGSTQITSANMAYIKCGTGSASFDPSTNTLTFNNATAISGTYNGKIASNCMVYTEIPLKIRGSAKLLAPNITTMIIGSYMAALDIQGNFDFSGGKNGFFSTDKITISGGNTSITIKNADKAISGRGGVLVDGGTLEFTSVNQGIYTDTGALELLSGKISISAKESVVLAYDNNDINIASDLIFETPKNFTIKNIKVGDSSYNVIADEAGNIAKELRAASAQPATYGEAPAPEPEPETKPEDNTSKTGLQPVQEVKKVEEPAPEGKKEGTTFTVAEKAAEFVVTSSAQENPTVDYKCTINKKAKKITVPETVTVDGITYNVTGIATKAFSGCKNLKTVTIGNNVINIRANAFKGAKNLNTINVKSTKLTKDTVASKAFKGTPKNVTVKVPKKLKKTYQKLFIKKGLAKNAKIR